MLSNILRQRVWWPTYAPGMDDSDAIRLGIGLRLKAARNVKGLTQQQVADRLGVIKGTVSAWETGRWSPEAVTLRALARLYDVSADAILWENSLTPEALQFAAEFDSLSDAQRKTLRAVWMAFVATAATDASVEKHLPMVVQQTKERT